MAQDPELARSVERLSHGRAIRNLSEGGADPATWARVAGASIDHLSAREADRMLVEAGHGAGLAILFGNILDTIPGCLVIGAKFVSLDNLSVTLILGMFLGGIPEAAASGAMLRRAGYRPSKIFLLWSVVLVAGIGAAIAGKLLLGGSESMAAIFFQAIAGGAVLALVAHAMIPEAIDGAGSVVVLPTVAGFLTALYLAAAELFPGS
jgi:zinc transporter ZupT